MSGMTSVRCSAMNNDGPIICIPQPGDCITHRRDNGAPNAPRGHGHTISESIDDLKRQEAELTVAVAL